MWKGDIHLADVTHADILHFLLQLESLQQQAIRDCVSCINSGKINGKSALYCVSELRLAINKMTVHGETDDESHSTLISEIGEYCLEPLINRGEFDLQSFTTCLELIPAVIEALHSLHENELVTDLLNSLFYVKWDLDILLPISSILCELYPYLSKDHLRLFKVIDVQSY